MSFDPHWDFLGHHRIRRACSAELHSAVSPICNRRCARTRALRQLVEASAGCKPAIQQIENLRYDAGVHPRLSER